MTYKEKTVAVQHVFLDNDNPRHDPIDNEPEIIHQLVMNERVATLAADIAKVGLSPLDRMAVIPHESQPARFVTVEGNRRLCAIKLLADPDKAPAEQRATFKTLKKGAAQQITSLEVVVFPDRAAARHWLELRHEGPLDGVGTKPWNPTQKARWNAGGRQDNPNALALDVLDYAEKHGLITAAQRAKISLTTLTRYLKSPVVRTSLGIKTARGLEIRVSQADFHKALKRFLTDAIAGKAVTSRSNADDREAYAARLHADGVAPTPTSLNLTLDPATGKATAAQQAAQAAAGPKRHSASPRDRSHVIPPSWVVKIKDPILKRIYDELRAINTDDFPFAAYALFRGLVEVTTRRYCTKHGLTYNDRDLAKTLQAVEDHLRNLTGMKEHLTKGMRTMASNKELGFSPESIGTAIHGGTVAQRRYLNDGFDSIEVGLRAMMENL